MWNMSHDCKICKNVAFNLTALNNDHAIQAVNLVSEGVFF